MVAAGAGGAYSFVSYYIDSDCDAIPLREHWRTLRSALPRRRTSTLLLTPLMRWLLAALVLSAACAHPTPPLLVPPLAARTDSLAEARWLDSVRAGCNGRLKILYDETANELVRDSLARPVFRARRHLAGVQCAPR